MADNLKIKQISVYNITEPVTLAYDIVSRNGLILIPKGSKVNKNEIDKLTEKGIYNIKIIDNSPSEFIPKTEQDYISEVKNSPNITNKEEYTDFRKDYDKNMYAAKDMLLEFGKGMEIKIDEIYEITNDILGNLKRKSDVFTYMLYLKENESHTFAHSVNVSLLCNIFAKWVNMNEKETLVLTVAGLLHDIGKIHVDRSILNKKDKLTDNEYVAIKSHTYRGYEIVKDMNLPDDVKKSVLMHHEKLDGSGYPLGLKGSEINDIARIVSICDIYEAMTAERCYHPKICPFEVIRDFEENKFGSLDTKYLLIFLKNIAYTYVGAQVILNDDRLAEVIFINSNSFSRPIVKCGSEFIDLSKSKNVSIKQIC